MTASFWQPPSATSWFIDLSESFSPDCIRPNITAYDIDLFANNLSLFHIIDSQRKSICYFSAGSYEDWRPDAAKFTKQDYGKPLEGWEGEFWEDTRSQNVRNIVLSRLDMAKSKGCNAVDPDNIDPYDNDNGLDLTQDDAVDYVKFLADAAHQRGMAMGLRNGADIIDQVLDSVQFSVNEQSVQYKECDDYRPFVDANKPVFHIEYPDQMDASAVEIICKDQSTRGFSTIIKHMNLDAFSIDCPVASTPSSGAADNSINTSSPSPTSTSGSRKSVVALKGTIGVVLAMAIVFYRF